MRSSCGDEHAILNTHSDTTRGAQVELELDDAEERANDVQRVYYMAFHELCRQVMVQSVPRGELMHRLWMDHTHLYEVKLQGTPRHHSTARAHAPTPPRRVLAGPPPRVTHRQPSQSAAAQPPPQVARHRRLL